MVTPRLENWLVNLTVVAVFAAAVAADHYPKANVPLGIFAFVAAFGMAGRQLYLTIKETR